MGIEDMDTGDLFIADPDTIMAEAYEVIVAQGMNLGEDVQQWAYMFTFHGKQASSETGQGATTIAMSPRDAYQFAAHVLQDCVRLATANGGVLPR